MSKAVPFTGDYVPGAYIIQEAEVSVERLRSLLETAVIDLELDAEGDLYLTGGVDFPLWVCLDRDRKLIELLTFIGKVATDAATVALRLNKLNSNFALGQFHHLDDAIYSGHIAQGSPHDWKEVGSQVTRETVANHLTRARQRDKVQDRVERLVDALSALGELSERASDWIWNPRLGSQDNNRTGLISSDLMLARSMVTEALKCNLLLLKEP